MTSFFNTLSHDYLKLLQTGHGADVIVEAGGKKFILHSWILRTRSPFFDRILGEAEFESNDKALSPTESVVLESISLDTFEQIAQ